VDLVRSIYADWERGDFGDVESAHPEIELVFADGPTPGSWTGIESATVAWRDFLRTWVEYRVEAGEYLELDNGRVLVLDHERGSGKLSGLDIGDIKAKGASLFRIRYGKVTRLVIYWDRDRALADLGLE
jgi:hypothetical protein